VRRAVLRSACAVAAFAVLSASFSAATARGQSAGTGAHRREDERNPPPVSDGIHDSGLEGTHLLQPPQEAFSELPKANGGNYVNWTEALKSGKMQPLSAIGSTKEKRAVLTLDIVRGAKGYVPPAVFSHAAHTEWLDCPVCHPGLFVAKEGANSMTMAEIMLGKKCGVCHGTVAFPAAECRRCHYQPSPKAARPAARDTGRKPAHPGSKPENTAAKSGG